MIKSNIREQTANKLTTFDLILERIIDGKPVSTEIAKKAGKDIREVVVWLDKKEFKTTIRTQAVNKLNAFDLILGKIIDGKIVAIESAKTAQKDVQAIMAWLDKRDYKTETI